MRWVRVVLAGSYVWSHVYAHAGRARLSLLAHHPLGVSTGFMSRSRIPAAPLSDPSGWLTSWIKMSAIVPPEGFLERALRRGYGDALAVLFASRLDQIHLKLYAAVDQGPGRHLSDLQALQPSAAELVQAARWSRTHDPSEGYRGVLVEVLEHLGVSDGLDGV
jgi:hypothetical protein